MKSHAPGTLAGAHARLMVVPPEIDVNSIFELLGAPAEQKRLVVYPAGQSLLKIEVVKESLA